MKPSTQSDQTLRIVHDGMNPVTELEHSSDQSSRDRGTQLMAEEHPGSSADLRLVDSITSAPEPGIRRALSLVEQPPTLRRTTTETGDLGFNTEVDQIIADARSDRLKKKSSKMQTYRITRLTTHAADSFAWHSSAVLTKMILLPLEAMYWQASARCFQSLIQQGPGGLSLSSHGSQHLLLRYWQLWRPVLLSFGLEFAVRSLAWRVFLDVALRYGKQFEWGKF